MLFCYCREFVYWLLLMLYWYRLLLSLFLYKFKPCTVSPTYDCKSVIFRLTTVNTFITIELTPTTINSLDSSKIGIVSIFCHSITLFPIELQIFPEKPSHRLIDPTKIRWEYTVLNVDLHVYPLWCKCNMQTNSGQHSFSSCTNITIKHKCKSFFNTLFMLEAIQVYIYDSKKRYQQEKRMRRTLATAAHRQYSIPQS